MALDWIRTRLSEKPPDPPSHIIGNVEEHRESDRARKALYYDVAKSRLDAQLAYSGSIDNKATSFFSIGSTILPIAAGFLTSNSSPVQDSRAAVWGLFGGFAAYLLLAIAFLLSHNSRKWASAPDMKQWQDIGLHYPAEDLHEALGNSYMLAYTTNEPETESKAVKTGWAIWFLLAEVIGLGIAVLAPLWPPW